MSDPPSRRDRRNSAGGAPATDPFGRPIETSADATDAFGNPLRSAPVVGSPAPVEVSAPASSAAPYAPTGSPTSTAASPAASPWGVSAGPVVARAEGPTAATVEPPSSATMAMVLGIAGLIFVPLLFSIPAWVVGARARRESRALPGRPGYGMATTGWILGIVSTLFWVLVGALLLLGLVALAGSGELVTGD
ncbi:MAG: DUF4190 domain-containing protein [Patulibacter sp.]